MFRKVLQHLHLFSASTHRSVKAPGTKSIIHRVSNKSRQFVIAMIVTFGGQFFMILVACIAVAMLIFVTYYSKEALEMIATDGRLPSADRGAALIAGIKTVTDTIFPVFSVVLVVLTTSFAGIWYVRKNIQATADSIIDEAKSLVNPPSDDSPAAK